MDNERFNYARSTSYEGEKVNGSVDDAKSEKTQKLKFSVTEHPIELDFPVVERVVTTTNSFAKLIGSLFSASFSDYDGCVIEPTKENANVPMLSIFFKQLPYGQENDSRLKGIVSTVGTNTVADRRTSNFGMAAINNFNKRFAKNRFMLTDEAMELLDPYVMEIKRKSKNNLNFGPTKPTKGDADWNKITSELVDQVPYNDPRFNGAIPGTILVKVSHLDLGLFLKLMYGENALLTREEIKAKKDRKERLTDEERGSFYSYRVLFGGVLGVKNDRILVIERIKAKDQNQIIDYAGMPFSPSSVYRVR